MTSQLVKGKMYIADDTWYQASAEKMKSITLFWVIIQRVVVISYRRFGQPVGPIFRE